MVARSRAWLRAAAVGILMSWLPCVPVGLCVPAPSEVSAHSCCPRSAAATMSAAPRECWLQSPAPLPAGPPPAAQTAPAVAVSILRSGEGVVPARPIPAAFSPLAVVLRI